MNEDYNILENALLYAPKGTQLWSDVDGVVELDRYHDRSYLTRFYLRNESYPSSVIHVKESTTYSLNGHYGDNGLSSRGNCVLWPSKDHRTWVNWQSVLFKAGTFIYNVKQKKVKIFHHFDTNGITYTGKLSDGSTAFGALGDCRFASNEQIEQFKAEQERSNKNIDCYESLVDIAVRASFFFTQQETRENLENWNTQFKLGLTDKDLEELIISLKTSIKMNDVYDQ